MMHQFNRSVVAAVLFFAGMTAVDAEINIQDLAGKDAPAGAIWLDSQDLSAVKLGWGTVGAGKAVGGRNPISINNRTFMHGIGVHAESGAYVALGKTAARFVAFVGVDDQTGNKGSVVFQVWVDNVKKADSGLMRGGDAPKLLSVDLAGATLMKLVVTDGGDGCDSDHADWAGAAVFAKGDSVKVVSEIASVPRTPAKAPAFSGLYLKAGDKLAICGDSITQQNLYSRIIETYLTVCVPELKITARQYGWSGEVAEGFLHRMTNDCLRFKPTIATMCYGMNDFRYRPYDEANGKWYRDNITAVAKAFKGGGARVIIGSPGCVGKVCTWVASIGTLEQHNQALCMLRNIDIEVAAQEGVRFADIFCPLYDGGCDARQKYGADYAIAGGDGIHPGMAGHLVMAYAFLSAMGLDGNIGTFTVDLARGKAAATDGHKVDEFKYGTLTVTSTRYPFCATGPTNKDSSIRSGMTLVPFNEKLNRLMLVVKGGNASKYKVTWGTTSRSYSAKQLAKGINLAADFEANPFSEAFAKVDGAVAGKEGFEIGQIQQIVHSAQGHSDKEADVQKSEVEHEARAAAIRAAFVPVTHTLRIEGE